MKDYPETENRIEVSKRLRQRFIRGCSPRAELRNEEALFVKAYVVSFLLASQLRILNTATGELR
jgi:hypothetical protein